MKFSAGPRVENSDIADAFAPRSRCDSLSSLARRLPCPAATLRADVGVQCELKDMLEPISHPTIKASFAKTAMRRWQNEAESSIKDKDCWQRRVVDGEGYSVESHFALFTAPDALSHAAMALGDDELEALAGRFFGAEIAGCAAVKESASCERPMYMQWPRVDERHVDVATALAEALPAFRSALRSAAVQFFFTGLQSRPFQGRSVLTLAIHEPRRWICRAFRALDFAARLACRGALRRAFPAAIAARLCAAGPKPASCALQLFAMQQLQPRPALPLMEAAVPAAVARTRAQPQRTVGTSLRPYDEVCFSRISMAPARLLCEEIP